MKNLRTLGLLPSILALLTLSCQTVTRLYSPSTPTPARGRPTARVNPTTTPRAANPTATAVAAPSAALPTLGTLAETENALNSGSVSYLDELANEHYSSADLLQMDTTFPYTIDLTRDQNLLWQAGWCATTRDILQQNLSLMAYKFSINDKPVDLSRFYLSDDQQTQANQTLYCHSYVAVVSHWPKGTTTLQVVVTFDATLNDGLDDYPPGRQTFVYTVTR
jgi:hypothetical protein